MAAINDITLTYGRNRNTEKTIIEEAIFSSTYAAWEKKKLLKAVHMWCTKILVKWLMLLINFIIDSVMKLHDLHVLKSAHQTSTKHIRDPF